MSNRLDHEFPNASRQYAPPPIGADGIQYLRERGRHERAIALRAGLRWSGSALLRALKAVLDFVRCGGYGISKRVPDSSTGPCW